MTRIPVALSISGRLLPIISVACILCRGLNPSSGESPRLGQRSKILSVHYLTGHRPGVTIKFTLLVCEIHRFLCLFILYSCFIGLFLYLTKCSLSCVPYPP